MPEAQSATGAEHYSNEMNPNRQKRISVVADYLIRATLQTDVRIGRDMEVDVCGWGFITVKDRS